MITKAIKLADLDLGLQTKYALERAGIKVATDLTKYTAEQLLEMPRIGEGRVIEIQKALAQHELALNGSTLEEEPLERKSRVKRYTDVQCPVCKVLPGFACEPGSNAIGPRKPHPERLALMKELKHGTKAPKAKFDVPTPKDLAEKFAETHQPPQDEPTLPSPEHDEPEAVEPDEYRPGLIAMSMETLAEILSDPERGAEHAMRAILIQNIYLSKKVGALESTIEEMLAAGLRPVVNQVVLERMVRSALADALYRPKQLVISFQE